MTQLIVRPSKVEGVIHLPPSKSHTMRALLFAAMAQGYSTIEHYLDSPDTLAMITALRQFGAKVYSGTTSLSVEGVAAYPTTPEQVIDSGNSGQVLRFGGAIAALASGYSVLTGDTSIRSRRRVGSLVEGLRQLGAEAFTSRGNGFAPLIVRGRLQAGYCHIEDGSDSQPISALLIASSYLPGRTEITVNNPGELPWIAMTLSWLARQGVNVHNSAYRRYVVEGLVERPGFQYRIPGDFSSAAFPLVAAAITESTLTVENVDINDVQGDKEIIDVLRAMGAFIIVERESLTIQGKELCGIEWDINGLIDALPILAVAGCFAKGQTRLYNAAVARTKESDRLYAICQELAKMGADIEENDDEVLIRPSVLTGAVVNAHHDHRIAMALAVAALAAQGATVIRGVDCIAKSYPHFAQAFMDIGADIVEEPSP